MDAMNAPRVEQEPDLSKGRVLDVGGRGPEEGEESKTSAATQEALSESVAYQISNQFC